MARGGINKALVIKARQNLLAKGQNPSIDAIRMELGNTGSKSTIHRYLKEIEAAESTKLNDEALLSHPIRELVSRLASELKQEADTIVEKSEKHFRSRVENLENAIKETEQKNEALTEELAQSESSMKTKSVEFADLESGNNAVTIELNQAMEEQSRLNTVIDEKQTQIDSLEEKHVHSREALQHYRESVKEQREQDIRQNEQQIQQLHMEIRKLSETLSVKQGEVTQLNKDNARLISELTTTRRKANDLETKVLSSGKTVESLKIENATLDNSLINAKTDEERLTIELSEANKKLEETAELNKTLAVESAKLESESEIKTELLDKLLSEK